MSSSTQEAIHKMSGEPPVGHERHDEVELRIRFLSGRDVPCPACGYNLRNTRGERCGECGEVIRLGLPSNPRLGPFACCLCAVAAPIGFAATVAAPGWWRIVDQYRRHDVETLRFYGWGRADWLNIYASSAVVLAGLIILAILVRRSSRFLARRRQTQWIIAAVGLLLGIGAIVGLIETYRFTYRRFS